MAWRDGANERGGWRIVLFLKNVDRGKLEGSSVMGGASRGEVG